MIDISIQHFPPFLHCAENTKGRVFTLSRSTDARHKHNITARPDDGKLSCSDQVRTEKNGTALYFVIWKGNKHNYYISKEGCPKEYKMSLSDVLGRKSFNKYHEDVSRYKLMFPWARPLRPLRRPPVRLLGSWLRCGTEHLRLPHCCASSHKERSAVDTLSTLCLDIIYTPENCPEVSNYI